MGEGAPRRLQASWPSHRVPPRHSGPPRYSPGQGDAGKPTLLSPGWNLTHRQREHVRWRTLGAGGQGRFLDQIQIGQWPLGTWTLALLHLPLSAPFSSPCPRSGMVFPRGCPHGLPFQSQPIPGLLGSVGRAPPAPLWSKRQQVFHTRGPCVKTAWRSGQVAPSGSAIQSRQGRMRCVIKRKLTNYILRAPSS